MKVKWTCGHVLMERLRVCQGILDLGNTGRIWRNYPKITFCKTLEGTKEIISNNIPVWYEILDYCNLILWYCCSANGPAADCFTRVCSGHMKVRRMRLANDEEVGMERKVLGARCSWWPWWPWWLFLPTAKKLGWEGRYQGNSAHKRVCSAHLQVRRMRNEDGKEGIKGAVLLM